MKHKNVILIGALLLASLLTGCYHSSEVKSAAGTQRSNMFAFGMVSTSTTDTTIGQEDCEEALLTFQKGETPMTHADVYAPCFAVGMTNPVPNGQQPPPIPRDLNGDGRQDAVQYPNGLLVPAHLYNAYPRAYWPGIYMQYGITPEAMNGMAIQQYGNITAMRHRGYVWGHPGDPITAGTPDELITRRKLDQELNPLYQEVDANATDIMTGANGSKRK